MIRPRVATVDSLTGEKIASQSGEEDANILCMESLLDKAAVLQSFDLSAAGGLLTSGYLAYVEIKWAEAVVRSDNPCMRRQLSLHVSVDGLLVRVPGKGCLSVLTVYSSLPVPAANACEEEEKKKREHGLKRC